MEWRLDAREGAGRLRKGVRFERLMYYLASLFGDVLNHKNISVVGLNLDEVINYLSISCQAYD